MTQEPLPGLDDGVPRRKLSDLYSGSTPRQIIEEVRARCRWINDHHSTVMHQAISADRRRTMERNALLAGGWHPLTQLPLFVGTGETCGDCAHHIRQKYRTKAYHKCELRGVTRGPATDLRVSWPACAAFEREEDE